MEASHLVGVALVFANEGRIPVMDVLAEFESQHEMFPLAGIFDTGDWRIYRRRWCDRGALSHQLPW